MKRQAFLIGVMVILILLCGCAQEPAQPENALSVAELFATPIYDTRVQVYGEVSALGELMCTCFFLESEGPNIHVWYDTMVEDNGAQRSSVDIEDIKNGDWVIITGELKSGGDHYSINDFWLSHIEVIR